MYDRNGDPIWMSSWWFLVYFVLVFGGNAAHFVGETVLGFDRTPLSPILLAILLGLVIRNVIGLPSASTTGVRPNPEDLGTARRIFRQLGVVLPESEGDITSNVIPIGLLLEL